MALRPCPGPGLGLYSVVELFYQEKGLICRMSLKYRSILPTGDIFAFVAIIDYNWLYGL